MKIPKLTWDEDGAFVRGLREWADAEYASTALDVINDWMADLTEEYNRQVERLYGGETHFKPASNRQTGRLKVTDK